MNVKFWGTRGSIPVPGRDTVVYGGNTTCLEVTLDNGRKIIIDAGTGIRALGESLIARRERVDVVLLMTHIHWDHVLGFPFFEPLYETGSRIAIDGCRFCVRGLRVPFDNNMVDGFFPVKFHDLAAEIRYLERLRHGPLKFDEARVDTIPLRHPQGGLGYRFRERKKTLVFLTDNELTEDSPEGRRPGDYRAFCKGADVLIHDAQYTPREREMRKNWGHSDYVSALKLALQSGVRRLILFHHDPARRDDEMEPIRDHCRELAREAKTSLEIEIAMEGNEFVL